MFIRIAVKPEAFKSNNPGYIVWTTHIVYKGIHTWYTVKEDKFVVKSHALQRTEYHESTN